MPPTIELEEALRNGVLCAKLANFFAPEIAPMRKIFDKDLTRYKVRFFCQLSKSLIFACSLLSLILYT